MRVQTPILISRQIQDRMLLKGLNQTELADCVGVSQGQISKFLRGDFRRLSKNILKVMDYLQIPRAGQYNDGRIRYANVSESLSAEEKIRFANTLRQIASLVE